MPQPFGLRRRHATASWAYLFRLIKLLSSSSIAQGGELWVDLGERLKAYMGFIREEKEYSLGGSGA